MRSSILISRISRLVETAGAAGDGATLASLYAEAVRKVNARMEAVVTAADAKGASDAVRILSEEPPLIEEVSTLDFFQLSDWENLCDMQGWEIPPKIDKGLTERVVEIAENKDAIAPFLAMYKKAVRVNNVRLAVKSLRRLADIDKSQDWRRNLKQSERQLQDVILAEFRKAETDEDRERLAQELLDGVWSEGLVAKGTEEVRAYRDRREAERRAQLGKEDLTILKRCHDEKWDRKLAFSMVQAIDALVEKGWRVPDEETAVLADCRARCAREFEAEEKERRWKEVNEQLHSAIQQENCEAIRDVLSLPEFLDRDPEGGLLQQARDVIEHAEAARRRKTMQIAVFAFLGVLAVAGVSGWWLRQKMFQKRCADEVVKLEYLEKKAKETPSHSIVLMTSELAKLKSDEPDVYAYPNVNTFEGRLAAMIASNLSRTNGIVSTLVELERLQAAEWQDADAGGTVTGRMEAVTRALVKEDADYWSRLLAVQNAWQDHVNKVEADKKAQATKFHAMLVSRLETVSARLKKELAREDLDREVKNCRDAIEEWRKVHCENAADLDAALTEVETKFNAAVEAQAVYKEALEKLASARTAEETLVARKALIDYYGNYPEVKALAPLDVAADEVKDILEGKSAAMEQFAASLKRGLSSEEFASFLETGVRILAEADEYYSLFALMTKDDPTGKIVAVSKGKPKLTKPSYESKLTISSNGGILRYLERDMVDEMKTSAKVAEFEMPSSEEITTVVDLANKEGVSSAQFERELLRLIDRHIKAAHQPKYVEDEAARVSRSNPYKGWMCAYRRVQLLKFYLLWLKEDMKLLPDSDPRFDRWYRRADDLSQSITVKGIDDGLAWLCFWNERVQERNAACAKFLSELPMDWLKHYKEAREKENKRREVTGWKVEFAGKIKFDPRDAGYLKHPDAIIPVVLNANNDHPLYVLRRVVGKETLVKAFEKGEKAPWKMCSDVQRHGGYNLGEPLYHVLAGGRFINVAEELEKLLGKGTAGIPLFAEGGK